jgi:hypothetical protein
MKWTDFLFVDDVTGEDFLVEVHDTPDAQSEAEAIAEENFKEPKLICQMSEEEGEMLGLDTY